jgi:hypothetical protein
VSACRSLLRPRSGSSTSHSDHQHPPNLGRTPEGWASGARAVVQWRSGEPTGLSALRALRSGLSISVSSPNSTLDSSRGARYRRACPQVSFGFRSAVLKPRIDVLGLGGSVTHDRSRGFVEAVTRGSQAAEPGRSARIVGQGASPRAMRPSRHESGSASTSVDELMTKVDDSDVEPLPTPMQGQRSVRRSRSRMLTTPWRPHDDAVAAEFAIARTLLADR